jgi:hypothetical protein
MKDSRISLPLFHRLIENTKRNIQKQVAVVARSDDFSHQVTTEVVTTN